MSQKLDLNAVVPPSMSGERLDQAAAQLFSDYSRSRLQTWIKNGELRVDGQQRRTRDKVVEGMSLSVEVELEPEVSWVGQEIDLDIIFEDESLMILNKPAGLVVHPGAGNPDGTLVNALLNHNADMANLPRGGIVHRLDKETSGIMVVAKTLPAHHNLVNQLQNRTVKRQYTAVCVGTMTGGGTVNEPIGRHPKQRKRMAVRAIGGKPAITHYRLVTRFANHTRIVVNLETGRTHQIRVHMAYRKYPLIGDPVYGGRPRIPKGASEELITMLRTFPRQALHAQALTLMHPESDEELYFECPVADDILALVDTLAREDPFVSNENY